jgi:glutamine synthetase
MLSAFATFTGKRILNKPITYRSYTSSTKDNDFDFERDFGKHVFSESTMESRLAPSVFKNYKKCMENRLPIDLDTADAIAQAMKDWAQSFGATHFTHWFQPLNGWVAEKHDSFVSNISKGRALSHFKGKALIGGETDGSSFPSGGLRATHLARGYTLWDPQTPPFLMTETGDITLYVPACFYSFRGHALDRKIPLLRSTIALEKAGKHLFEVIGEKGHTSFFFRILESSKNSLFSMKNTF